MMYCKTTFVSITVFLLAMFSSDFVGAGELAANLEKQILSASPDQPVKVWIKLQAADDRTARRTAAVGKSISRVERYRTAANHLKDTHFEMQKTLLTELNRLRVEDRARNIKPHWLINAVEAEVSTGEIALLAARDDVEMIYPVPEIHLITPDKSDQIPAHGTAVSGVGQNLSAINADDVWATGFTGEGRLICSFDTGVDGDHPALSGNWKGNDGNYGAAWFFPYDTGDGTPRAVPDCGYTNGCAINHGTHVMGTMVGHDDATGDTTGVAPGAKWISAAVIDIAGTSIIDAFEWAVNPDGDLNTVDDVPDVINHSWGVINIGCEDIFFDLIDNTEALGIVNILAAGNEGPATEGIRNPANRALDSLDCFAIGNVNAGVSPPTVWSSSSRGPSDCNGAIKPNVCAPGTGIVSTLPGGDYGIMTGTSMAAPHVSGLVALMRQKNPNATVMEIKEAILTTAKAYDYNLPDNDYGWGVIDCQAAVNALSSPAAEPKVRVYAFDHAAISPGDIVSGHVALQNLGSDLYEVEAALSGSDPSLTILDGVVTFGTITESDTSWSDNTISVAVSDTVTEGTILSLGFDITGSGGYSETAKLYFLIEPALQRSYVTHNAGRIEFTLSNYGTFGFAPASFCPIGGVGFKFDGFDNDLYEGGLMVSIDSTHVSDGMHNSIGEPDGDFSVLPGGNIEIIEPGPVALQQTLARFTDDRAENPIGLEIAQESYSSFDMASGDDFMILRYLVKNISGEDITNLFFGLYLDWDILDYSSNAGGYESAGEFNWMAYNDNGILSDYRGAKLLDGELFTAFTDTGYMVYYDGGDGFTEAEKHGTLSAGFSGADENKTDSLELIQVIAARLSLLPVGGIDTVAFALLAGDTFDDISGAADRAQQAYSDFVTDIRIRDRDDDGLPDVFTLRPNYPNPFNPMTVISFDLPRASEYKLTIYNIVGQKVDEFSGKASAGTVEVEWNAANMASGVYLYKLNAGDNSASRKMVLLK